MTTELGGRRIVITGAATGIGLAAVREIAKQGAQVAAVYHNSPPPPELADAATWLRCDLTDKACVDAAFAAIAGQFGGIDVLLHAAGLWAPATPEGVTEAELNTLVGVNLNATVFANQAAFAWMRDSGGAIINLGSVTLSGVAGAHRPAACSRTSMPPNRPATAAKAASTDALSVRSHRTHVAASARSGGGGLL
jgi:3-oxoacyl-[acyl-carrier protein] reductase